MALSEPRVSIAMVKNEILRNIHMHPLSQAGGLSINQKARISISRIRANSPVGNEPSPAHSTFTGFGHSRAVVLPNRYLHAAGAVLKA